MREQAHFSIRDELILAFCRLGVAGLAPKAPGTWGTLVGCLLAPFLFFPLPFLWRIIVLAAVFVAGALAASRAEKILGEKDPGQVVIDELVGVWLVFLPYAQPGIWLMVTAFILFRIFDIFKPWPIKASENWLPGGWGVMIDDIVAGAWALLFVQIFVWMEMI